MASSSSAAALLEDLYARITLEEENEGTLVPDALSGGAEGTNFRWCLVGRLLTDRPTNFVALKNTLASIWRPVKGVCIKDLGPNLFMFQFFHELDLERVLKGGPWTFDHFLLITGKVEVGMCPTQIPLYYSDFWVQVYDLPYGFMSVKVAQEIGGALGTFIEADANNFGGAWMNYMRIRVSLDVRKPLKRRMKIKKAGEGWSWVTFKYERLPTFCFFCGMLGHGDRFCEKFVDCKDRTMEKPYGA